MPVQENRLEEHWFYRQEMDHALCFAEQYCHECESVCESWVKTLTGTRGAYRSYHIVKPKIEAWQPKVAQRGTPPLQ